MPSLDGSKPAEVRPAVDEVRRASAIAVTAPFLVSVQRKHVASTARGIVGSTRGGRVLYAPA